MQRLDTEQDLAAAVARLAECEPRFAGIAERHGLPPLRHAEPGARSLLRIVTDQLISLQAGAAIWARLAARLEPFAPDIILACPQEELRALGLSAAKARCFHAVAQAFAAGAPHTENQGTDEIVRTLTAIPGIGPWTAQIYMLTALRAADAWPAGDIALQHAAAALLALPARPTTAQMIEIAEEWRPHRSTAALLLWSHYRAVKRMPQG
jgi:DNA-3-methyladenine glycosylase II